MDRLVSREREVEGDLESGGTTSEDERARDQVPGKGQMNGKLGRALSGLFTFPGSDKNEFSINTCSSSSSLGGVEVENEFLLVDKNSEAEESYQCLDFGERNSAEEERKRRNSRKPPRPPKGPLLDAADRKLVREIAELAVRKRARMKRIRTLKKMREAKASYSSSSVYALVITFLFCLVIIFQGICPRSRGSTTLEGSPAPAVVSSGRLISVQVYKNFTQDLVENFGSTGVG